MRWSGEPSHTPFVPISRCPLFRNTERSIWPVHDQRRSSLNGTPVGQFSTNIDEPINFRVFHMDVSATLRVGDNVLAIEAVRGRGVIAGSSPLSTQQLA
jgi:hypothetical protein